MPGWAVPVRLKLVVRLGSCALGLIGTSINSGPDHQSRNKLLGNDKVHNVRSGGLGRFGLNKNGFDANGETGIEAAQQRGQVNGCLGERCW